MILSNKGAEMTSYLDGGGPWAQERRIREDTLNEWVAQWLNERSARPWEASAEELGAIVGRGKHPDLIVRQNDRLPVIAEFEFGGPAVADAVSRLGAQLTGEKRPVSEVLAVGYSNECRTDNRDTFFKRLDDNEGILTVQLVSRRNGGNGRAKVWPTKPLSATCEDLIAYIEYLQVPQDVIEELTTHLAWSINSAGVHLYDSIRMSAGLCEETLASLRESTGTIHPENGANGKNGKSNRLSKGDRDAHAVRTTCAIWMVAIDLQNDLANHSSILKRLNLKSTDQLMQESVVGKLVANRVLEQWRMIAEVDYLPVIELAIETLQACDRLIAPVAQVLETMHELYQDVNAVQAKHVYNLAGELWQKLVPDREERAAHYTKPHIAELLATLGAERFAGRSARAIGALNLMDAACGTGTLLGAGERAIRRKYYMAGGRKRNLHSIRMENHIYALDVNGIAGAMTAKRLTDLDLERDYTKSQIAVVTHPAGSLFLLDPEVSGVSEVLGYKGVEPTTGAGGDEGVFHVEDSSIDWALMNPPYSRPRRGRKQQTTQLKPLRAAAKRGGYEMSHGVAGLATDFGDLSNIRLKPGGVFSHVLPLTAARSGSWTRWRAQLEKDFDDITVVFANQGMSADTNLGEILVVATKRRRRRRTARGGKTLLCVNLDLNVSTLAQGYAIAREILKIGDGGRSGKLSIGSWVRLNQTVPGNPWTGVGSIDPEVSDLADRLARGDIWDNQTEVSTLSAVPMVTLNDMVRVGPTHDLIGHPSDGDGRGAYQWTPLSELVFSPTQQSMWSADGETQTAIYTTPTHGGIAADEELARRINPQRSHWFIKRGMRWTSQATTMAHTRTAVHGGAAWTALLDGETDCMQAIALFHNSVFGGIIRNSYAATQKLGRAELHISAIGGLPCPAFNADTPEAAAARKIAADRFEDLSRLELMPFAACIEDANRHQIDSTVAEMLGLNPGDAQVQAMLDRYRLLFARQPNVHGGQKRYIRGLKRYEAATK